MTPSAPTIDTTLIPALERRMLGRTFYLAMERFYEDPNNLRRFKDWQKERKEAQKVDKPTAKT